ncbi:MAG: DinB family protein [Planctomycetaceae bacterium]|nr:DinB family protein [Planctomycetaceae bacterium]
MARTKLDIAIKNLEFAREYTRSLLKDIEPEDWFCQPTEGVTHLAWQVGHLAMAEYALTMIRIRGKEPEDAEFISSDFFKQFKKGVTPAPDPSQYPAPGEIRLVFDRVHERALEELQGYSDEDLEISLPAPTSVFDTKLGSVFFCSNHEMLHAGQIGLLRRLLGKAPVR